MKTEVSVDLKLRSCLSLCLSGVVWYRSSSRRNIVKIVFYLISSECG